MSTIATPRRHALGLPAGSIRALLGLTVQGLMWIIALAHPDKPLPPAFLYLMLIKLVILVHYFASHSKTQGKAVSHKHALGLPRGTIRLLLMGGFIAQMVMLWKHSRALELPPDADRLYGLVGLLVVGFFAGYVLSGVFRSPDGQIPSWLQDVQAWLSLLAVVGLVILVILYGVIKPSLEQSEQLTVDHVEAVLAALVGFYFGARS